MYHELVEWVSTVITQYTLPVLWAMDTPAFFKTVARAEHVQREKMKQLKKVR